ncbi:hypothetical protein EYV94_20585 [Puteibacter caeruleilacunae]|nr:hypothetical protein EYV94_20585 [Puteibacter caeruleilacunae]
MSENNIIEIDEEQFKHIIQRDFQSKSQEIVNHVYYILAQKGLTVGQFAEMMGEKVSYMDECLSGATDLTIGDIAKMSATLEVNLIRCVSARKIPSGLLDPSTEKKITRGIKAYKKKYDMTGRREQRWISRYLSMVEFKKKYGHLLFTNVIDRNQDLIAFVWKQRTARKENAMSKERIALLDLIGFIWEPGNEGRKCAGKQLSMKIWLTHYEELKAYKKEFGVSYVSTLSETHASLGNWVAKQRARIDLTEEQIELLKAIDFFDDNERLMGRKNNKN